MEKRMENIMSDLLHRDADTFVSRRTEGRINWEETISKGGCLSEYFLGKPDEEEVIRKAYSIASDMIKVMDSPFKVGIELRPGGTESCTDSRRVFVATDYFDDPRLTPGQKVDIFTGLTIHEGCHLLHTDFSVKSADRLVMNLANIIEDERIEMLIGESRPGLAGYLAAVKAHYWKGMAAKGLETDSMTRVQKVLCGVMGMVRYPSLLSEKLVDGCKDVLLQAREILTPFPQSTAEAMDTAGRIAALIREDVPEDDGAPDRGWDDTPEDDGTPSTEGSGGRCKKASAGGSHEEKGGASSASPGVDEEISELCDMLEKASTYEGDMSSRLRRTEFLPEIIEGKVEKGASPRSYFTRPEGDEARYRASMERVSPYVQRIRQAMRYHCLERDMSLRGMRSGHLDTGRIAEAVQGCATVYMQEHIARCSRRAVCILIDESGSMIREGRETAARDAAVLLNEALGDIPQLDLFIYGHTADITSGGTTDMHIYRERGYAPKWVLGSSHAEDNNRDGTAIMEAALRVRRQTREHVLMFILSDGAPAADGYIGREAIAHTREMVTRVTAMGFTPVQVCINASYDPSMMFDSWIKLEDMATLAPQLSRIIKERLVKDMRRNA